MHVSRQTLLIYNKYQNSCASSYIIFKTHTLASMNIELTLFPIETPFNTFANRADPDQAALTRAV